MNELTRRPAGLTDAAAIADLFRSIELAAPLGLETELAEVEARMSLPGLDLRADTLLAVDAKGTPLAYAETADMGVGQGQARVRITCAVRPGLGDEVTSTTIDWLLFRARQLLKEHHPGLPGVLGARCAAADLTRLALLTQAGFRVVFRLQDMARGVMPPLPVSPVPGITVVGYDLRYDEAARHAHNDAYAEDPGALLPDAQGWPQHATGLATFLLDASFLAVTAEAEIAGLLFSLGHHDSAGNVEGILHCLGTRAPWRRRGVAAALIARALAAYQVAGISTARLQVEDTNTSATRLYRRLGFTDGRGYAILQAPA
jgi:ribosomal protein S18 acetylase RimI-like enzyme